MYLWSDDVDDDFFWWGSVLELRWLDWLYVDDTDDSLSCINSNSSQLPFLSPLPILSFLIISLSSHLSSTSLGVVSLELLLYDESCESLDIWCNSSGGSICWRWCDVFTSLSSLWKCASLLVFLWKSPETSIGETGETGDSMVSLELLEDRACLWWWLYSACITAFKAGNEE